MKPAAVQLRTLYVRELVRGFMEDHLGCTNKEIIYGTGLNKHQVAQAIRDIRGEWQGRARRSNAPGRKTIEKGLLTIESYLLRSVPASEPVA